MSQPFVGEIRMFGGNFAPVGWAFCNGATVAIAENETLFNLIGTTYGGDGVQTFNLPDLQCRVPVHQGNGFVMGQKAGEESVTLTVNQIPVHSHTPLANSSGGADTPNGNVWATTTGSAPYGASPAPLSMNAASIQPAGGSQPHDNMIPFLAVNYIISLYGVFPSQN